MVVRQEELDMRTKAVTPQRPRLWRTAVVAAALAAAIPVCAAADGARLFDPIAAVLGHPRCMNCHMGAEALHRGEVGGPSESRIARAPEPKSVAAAPCRACHRDRNSADGTVPGAPRWRLAPPSTNWQGLGADELCAAIKDPARNGKRFTIAEVVAHMKSAPLVLWAWRPGAGREAPPLAHVEFVGALEAWAAAGAPCPGREATPAPRR
jgi:hypothetical protein